MCMYRTVGSNHSKSQPRTGHTREPDSSTTPPAQEHTQNTDTRAHTKQTDLTSHPQLTPTGGPLPTPPPNVRPSGSPSSLALIPPLEPLSHPYRPDRRPHSFPLPHPSAVVVIWRTHDRRRDTRHAHATCTCACTCTCTSLHTLITRHHPPLLAKEACLSPVDPPPPIRAPPYPSRQREHPMPVTYSCHVNRS